MTHASEIVSITLSHQKVLHCHKYVLNTLSAVESGVIAGASSVRKGRHQLEEFEADNLTGHLAMLAFHEYMQPHGVFTYATMRWYQDKSPATGDGGHDYPQLNVDVKASRIRDPERHLVRGYHLIVRPAERHEDWVYICALVDFDDGWQDAGTGAIVHLIGWATTAMFPYKVAPKGMFEGAYVLACSDLKALMPFRWSV